MKIKKFLTLFILSLFYSSASFSQTADCNPNCNISWEEIRNMRNPLWTKVDITQECADRVKARREAFEQDDSQNFDYLTDVTQNFH